MLPKGPPFTGTTGPVATMTAAFANGAATGFSNTLSNAANLFPYP